MIDKSKDDLSDPTDDYRKEYLNEDGNRKKEINNFDPEDVTELVNFFGIHGEHYKWTREEWQLEVAERNTQLGYWEWVLHSIESEN